MKEFETFGEWWQCVKSAAVHLGKFLCRLAQVVFIGLWSLLCALWRRVVRRVGDYPQTALVAFLVALLFTWLLTFVSMRARAVTAEDKCDSVSWQFMQFKEKYGYD